MSLRDKRRNQNNQQTSVKVVNLEAIAQMTQIEETPVIVEINETQPTIETGEDMNTTTNTPVEVEVELTEANAIVVDIAPETTDELKTDTEEVQHPGFEILTEWLGTFEPPKLENLVGLNLHTLTGASLVAALGMPKYIPTNIADILLEEMEGNPIVGNYRGVAEKIVKLYTSEQGVDVVQVVDFGLPLARPFVVTKTKPILVLLGAIQSFLQSPAAVQANVVEEASVEVKTTDKPVTATVATEDKTINVTVTISDKANVKAEAVAEEVPVVKGPEDLLAEWVLANPNYTFDQYFNKRNELYLAAA